MTGKEGERLAKVEQKLDDVVSRLDRFESKIDTFLDEANNRYSAKWVEKSFIGLITIIVSSLLGVFIFLLEKHII